MENCTISENEANNSGGGVFSNMGTATLNQCTVAYNKADLDVDGAGEGGGVAESFGVLSLSNSIVAYNTRSGNNRSDVAGTITSNGYNHIRELSGGVVIGDTTGNIIGLDPNLLPLMDNGGATMTYALASDSLCIDAANPDVCVRYDQRNKFRPYDGDADGVPRCDIGSYEFRGRKGDVNCDGLIDGLDIQAFVIALLTPVDYPRHFPGCEIENADVDSDGSIHDADIITLVQLLSGE